MAIISIVLVLVCLGIALLLWRQSRAIGGGNLKHLPPRSLPLDALRIENAGPGAVLHLMGVGPELAEFDLKVLARHAYRGKDVTWQELECDAVHGKVWLDVRPGDVLSLSVSLAEPRLSDLGLNRADLERFDDRKSGEFTYQGNTYHFVRAGQAVFYRNGEDRNAERLYRWEFESEGGQALIEVEAWGDGSLNAYACETLRLSQVTVYSLQ